MNYDKQEILTKLRAAKNLTELVEIKNKLSKQLIDDLQTQLAKATDVQVKTFQTLANLQGVLLDTIFEACIDHGLAYASEWRKYCNVGDGIGRENKKKQAQDKVKLWYNQNCTQDEADAICIGKYFVHVLKNNKSTWGEDI